MSHIFAQAQVDALELEKDSLGQQIDSLMVDRQNLLQVKMSLGLEVATYRYLIINTSKIQPLFIIIFRAIFTWSKTCM